MLPHETVLVALAAGCQTSIINRSPSTALPLGLAIVQGHALVSTTRKVLLATETGVKAVEEIESASGGDTKKPPVATPVAVNVATSAFVPSKLVAVAVVKIALPAPICAVARVAVPDSASLVKCPVVAVNVVTSAFVPSKLVAVAVVKIALPAPI